jgi:DNA-binding MarR family transcriptional regulator
LFVFIENAGAISLPDPSARVDDQRKGNRPMKKQLEMVYTPPSLEEIFGLIDVLSKRLKAFQRKTIRKAGLTPSQYFVLSILNEKDMRPLKDLAEINRCTRATMTGIIDTLEKRKLLSRKPNPEDRRSLLVQISAKGRKRIAGTPSLEKIFTGPCSDLTPEEIQMLSGLLQKLMRTLTF